MDACKPRRLPPSGSSLALAATALLLASCALFPPPVACNDESGWDPPPTLKCDEAVASALSALPAGHPPIDEILFDWGSPCPEDSFCRATMPSEGIITFHFREAPDGYIWVAKQGNAVRALSPLTPVGEMPAP